MSSDDHSFSEGNAGSSMTYPLNCNLCKKGGYIVLQGHPCKIVDKSVSKTGKHGGAKARIVGIDIFTGKKYEDIIPTSHNCDVPVIDNKTYPIMLIEGDHIEFMLENGDVRSDFVLDLEDQVCKDLIAAYEAHPKDEINIQIMSAMGLEKIVSFQVN